MSNLCVMVVAAGGRRWQRVAAKTSHAPNLSTIHVSARLTAGVNIRLNRQFHKVAVRAKVLPINYLSMVLSSQSTVCSRSAPLIVNAVSK